MSKHLIRLSFLAAAVGGAAVSQAFTMATFADPSPTGTPSLFNIDTVNNQITGGWSGTGLFLQTPGWAAPDYVDAKFSMAPVAIAPVAPGFWSTGGGQVDFTDSANNLVFRINFASGYLSVNGVGGSDLFGNNVTFSGPLVPAGLNQETFNFSFANFQPTANGLGVTAAFTSSAVPEPGTLAALGLGGLALLRRRRKTA